MTKQKLKRGLEHDAVTGWRKVLKFRPGQRAYAKRVLRRRARREAEIDILDWDTTVAVPPPKRSGTIRARLVYKGKDEPTC